MKLSVIIPVFNENKFIKSTVENVLDFHKEGIYVNLVIVDDCSDDGTYEILKDLEEKNSSRILLLKHDQNRGKGAAIRTALEKIDSDLVLIQDADLEYDPTDYSVLIEPFLKNDADVVYGTRFHGGRAVRVHLFWNYFANKILTLITNILTNINFSDMETGYKVFKTNVLKSIKLVENDFRFEPEVTIKLAYKKKKFFEVPISYNGRNYLEGKKIKTKDAILAVICLFRHFIFR